ncbi:MAG TPA: AAA family ATPase [Candidatus Polarisedimenticolia bacterium]|nr:AAA family ATPase [Candidatus Polarisedimenticolia bacterium]
MQAFGITDYFSAECYFTAVAEYRKRYRDSPKVFFPNVELRTNYVVNKAEEEVNVHLLFNPFQPDCDSRIKFFLSALNLTRTDRLDRDVKASELTRTADFESATTTREYIRKALTETYGRDADLLDHVLIVTAANNDGIRAKPGVKRKAELSDELDKFSDAFFGNAENVEWFLSRSRAQDKSEYTEPKPVLSGCDAHSLADLDAKLGQVFTTPADGVVLEPTWIKADLTYEGLKQIVFEPANRVHIGAEPEAERRVRQNGTRYIASLQLDCIAGYRKEQHGTWFCDERIALGKELVAVIGNKGSGKSAVTDVIGLLGNSHNQISKGLAGGRPEELFSFLNKEKFLKAGCAKHFEATLNWHQGEPDKKTLDEQTATHLPEKVEYLPQKYLERICANIADDEFRATLNEVIFRYVKPQDQHGKSDLDDLIKYRTQQAEKDIAEKKQELHQANAKVVAIEKKLTEDYRKELEEKLRLKKEDIEAHGKTCPEEKPNPEAETAGPSAETTQVEDLTRKIAELSEQIAQREIEQVETSTTVEQLRQLRQAIAREVASLTELETEHATTLQAAGLSLGQIVTLTLDYGPLDAVITQKEGHLEEIAALLRSADDIAAMDADDDAGLEAAATTTSLVCQKGVLETQKAELVERLAKPARDYQQYLTDLMLWTDHEKELRGDEQNPRVETLKGLERELGNIRAVYPDELRTARDEQQRIAKQVFSRKRGLTQFYDAVKRSIDVEIAKCRGDLGEYNISIEAGLRFNPSFSDEFLTLINQSAAGSFRGQEDGRTMLRRFTDPVTDWEDEAQVFAALDAIVEALHADKREEPAPRRDVFKQMKGQKTVQDLYDYLFGFDYLGTKYDLKVDGKDLSELSPGERGGLLLIFYLMLDRQEIPLVIDQPEDNLDNKSVYEILVKFIKQAKKRRQIILVTHNPNLAVVADAEQIIHVSIDKKDGRHDFDFFSGAIENPRINEAVVDILEGTLPAFDNRRLKYRRPNRRGR